MSPNAASPRIALIHALRDSVEPARAAFAADWPEAETFNLLDDSLSADLAAGAAEDAITERFLALARYAAATGVDAGRTAGILFTCSAFARPIEACQTALAIPVLKPNEAALEAALDAGPHIGLLATFPATLPSMRAELVAMARARGAAVKIEARLAEGALAALQAGDGADHDRAIAEVAAEMGPLDALVLAQFSMARAAPAVAPVPGRRLLTTPASAVAKLRHLLRGG
ncbi:MAG: arylsulfatase [Rhodospirillales bacterium]|nr:arylsulfatase [Rhodospirillales bacterium]